MLELIDVMAVASVHRYARAAGDETDDGVSGHGSAAPGQLDVHITSVHAFHDDTGVSRPGTMTRPGRLGRQNPLREGLLCARLAAHGVHKSVDNMLSGDVPLADGRIQAIDVALIQGLSHVHERVVTHDPLDRQVLLAHGAGDRALARLDRLLPALLGEPGSDLVASPRRAHERQPVPAGAGALSLGCEDFDSVAILESGVQRHEAAVDARAHSAVPDLGVHGIGEVNRGGGARQRQNIAFGGEDVDLGTGHLVAQ